MQNTPKYQVAACRWAPSLGELESTHRETWGTINYNPKEHKNIPTVFFGLYDLRDYLALWRHKGRCWILWAGSDLENLISGFAFNDGKLRLLSKLTAGFFSKWVKKQLKKASHYVEDLDEAFKLFNYTGINSTVVPSFLGRIESYTAPRKQYQHSFSPNVYISASEERQTEYGFDIIERIAPKLPKHIFHLYGASWHTNQPNIIVHGRIPKEEFNRQIRDFQCGLRLNKHDGFSEITAKSVLMGQYPITYLQYPLIPNFKTDQELIGFLDDLRSIMVPNTQAQKYYAKALNNFPWNIKKSDV